MTNLRAGLVAALEAGLPDTYRVVGYPKDFDAITGPTVCLWAASLAPAGTGGRYVVTYTVQVFTGRQDPAKADDALDASLSDVLAVLWDRTDIIVAGAERTVYDSKIHAWSLTLTAGIAITPNGA